MEMMQIAGFSVLAAFMALTLRKMNREAGLVLSLGAGLILLTIGILKLSGIVTVLSDLAQAANIKSSYLQMLLKIVGISTLAQFAAQTCRDADEEGLAQKVEFAAKAVLLTLLFPIVVSIVETIVGLMP